VLPRLLRENRCDVLHIPSYRRIVAAAGCPQVVTIHDCAPFRLAGKYDFARMLYGRHVVTRLARRAARVIAVSETTAADIRRFYSISPGRLSVVYNGINHALFAPVPREKIPDMLPVTRGWENDGGWWIYVARLEHPAKNHLRLLEAFAEFCKVHPAKPGRLVLAGADWHGAEEIHRAIAESPVRDRIHCAGFVPEADLPAWYSGARALVFPSLFEGFGLPPIEAMACGCPVLSSDRGSLREVVAGAGHLFNPEKPAEILEAMAVLSSNPEETARLREAGLARAAEFHWERCARETFAVYETAM
jgi:glycosyltransferase involved in cell wall biosynthesis